MKFFDKSDKPRHGRGTRPNHPKPDIKPTAQHTRGSRPVRERNWSFIKRDPKPKVGELWVWEHPSGELVIGSLTEDKIVKINASDPLPLEKIKPIHPYKQTAIEKISDLPYGVYGQVDGIPIDNKGEDPSGKFCFNTNDLLDIDEDGNPIIFGKIESYKEWKIYKQWTDIVKEIRESETMLDGWMYDFIEEIEGLPKGKSPSSQQMNTLTLIYGQYEKDCYIAQLREKGVNSEFIKWCMQEGHQTLRAAWKGCKRGDWMLNLICCYSEPLKSEKHRKLISTLCKCVKYLTGDAPYIVNHDEDLKIIKDWTEGEDTPTSNITEISHRYNYASEDKLKAFSFHADPVDAAIAYIESCIYAITQAVVSPSPLVASDYTRIAVNYAYNVAKRSDNASLIEDYHEIILHSYPTPPESG